MKNLSLVSLWLPAFTTHHDQMSYIKMLKQHINQILQTRIRLITKLIKALNHPLCCFQTRIRGGFSRNIINLQQCYLDHTYSSPSTWRTLQHPQLTSGSHLKYCLINLDMSGTIGYQLNYYSDIRQEPVTF